MKSSFKVYFCCILAERLLNRAHSKVLIKFSRLTHVFNTTTHISLWRLSKRFGQNTTPPKKAENGTTMIYGSVTDSLKNTLLFPTVGSHTYLGTVLCVNLPSETSVIGMT